VFVVNYIKIQNQLQLKNGTVDDSLAVSTFTAYAAVVHSPNKLATMWTEGGLAQECCHKLMSINLSALMVKTIII